MNKKILLSLIGVFSVALFFKPLFVVPLSLVAIALIIDLIPLRTTLSNEVAELKKEVLDHQKKIAGLTVTLSNRTRG